MANYTYDDFVSLLNSSGLSNGISQYDMNLAAGNPNAGVQILQAKQAWQSATTDAERAAANAQAEAIRAANGSYYGGNEGLEYNYFGNNGNSGSGYSSAYSGDIDSLMNSMLNRADYSYADYVNPYAQEIAALVDKVNNRDPFSYNYQDDDLFSSYKKQYLREGDRATANALAQASVLTGGSPSTAAISAATQAGDYYATQLTDKIPELEAQAYDKYLNEHSMNMNTLSMMNSMHDSDYNKYATDRAFDYQVWLDDYNIDLSNLQALQSLDNDAYNKFMTDLQYAASQDAANFEKDYNMAVLAAQYGDYSYLQKMGIQTGALQSASGSGSSGSGGSSGSSGSGGYSYSAADAQIQQMLKDAGYYTGAVDGLWGPQSEAAFQAYNAAGGGNGSAASGNVSSGAPINAVEHSQTHSSSASATNRQLATLLDLTERQNSGAGDAAVREAFVAAAIAKGFSITQVTNFINGQQ